MSTATPTAPGSIRWLAPCEVARLWGCSTETVLRLCRRSQLTHRRVNARVILIAEVDAALAFLAQQRRGSLPSGATQRGGRPWGSGTVST